MSDEGSRLSLYKVGVVLSVEDCPGGGGGGGGGKGGGNKKLRACKVDVGSSSDDPITVVTAAPNVRVGSR